MLKVEITKINVAIYYYTFPPSQSLFTDKRGSEKMKNQYISICLVTSTLSMFLFFWTRHFSKLEPTELKESSLSKYDFFISRLKESGKTSGLYQSG